MLTVLRSAALATLLLLGSGCALNGSYGHDETIIQQTIVTACLTSPLFKLVEGPIETAVPATVLPITIVNTGVSVVCADPAAFAAVDAQAADWTIYGISKTAVWVKSILHT
jgi:hypothetical protein